MNGGIEDRVQAMVPEVVLAVESLELATPEQIHTRLEQNNVKATRSETEMALEYGCRLGVMEEKRRYRLSSGLRCAILENADQSKKNINAETAENIKMERDYDNADLTSNSSMDEVDDEHDYYYNDDDSDKGSGSEVSLKRYKSDEKEVCSRDYEDPEHYADSESGDDIEGM